MSPEAFSFSQFREVGRYTLTGGLNTLVGFTVIVGLLTLGVSDIMSNAVGFGVGLLTSFFINRSWTFGQTSQPTATEMGLFIFSFLVAYGVNLSIILVGFSLEFKGSWLLQLAGVIAYSGSFYLLSKKVIYGTAGTPFFVNDVTRHILRYWPSYAFILVVALATPLLLRLPLTHDVSWQFWIARQMSYGVPLYERIMEINPPLWFWMALPLQIVGTYSGVQPDRLYIAAIILISAWSILTTGKLIFEKEPERRFGAMIAMLAFVWVGPIYDFGQREQLAIILAIPYCALIFKRVRNEPVSTSLVVAISVTAACGFALKHYFALVPFLLEVWYFAHHRKMMRVFRLETVLLGLCACTYSAAILYFTPEFLSTVVPLVASSYGGYERSIIFQLVRSEVLIWLCAAFGFFRLRSSLKKRDKQVGDMLAISAIGFAASYFLQQKGWQYHAIPATVCASLMLVHYISCQRNPVKSMAAHPLVLVGAVLFVTTGIARGAYQSDWASDMPKYLSGAKRGDSVMILTADPRRVFPFIDDARLIWPSRHFAHWMLAAIVKAEAEPEKYMTPKLMTVASDIRRQALADMKCNPPTIILSQIRNAGGTVSPETFRMTDFFRRDAGFKDYLAKDYRLNSRDRLFETYTRIKLPGPKAADCYPVYVAS